MKETSTKNRKQKILEQEVETSWIVEQKILTERKSDSEKASPLMYAIL